MQSGTVAWNMAEKESGHREFTERQKRTFKGTCLSKFPRVSMTKCRELGVTQQQRFISQSWRPEVRIHGVGLVVLSREAPGNTPSAPLPAPGVYGGPRLSSARSYTPAITRPSAPRASSHPRPSVHAPFVRTPVRPDERLRFHLVNSVKTPFPKGCVFRTSTYLRGQGDKLTPLILNQWSR